MHCKGDNHPTKESKSDGEVKGQRGKSETPIRSDMMEHKLNEYGGNGVKEYNQI